MSEKIAIWVEKSRSAILRVGKANLEATAYTYLVFRASWGPDADQAARADFRSAIDATNKDIKIENGKLATLRDRGIRFIGKKLIADAVFNALPDNHRDKKNARHLGALKLGAFKKLQSVELSYDEEKRDEVLSAVVRHSTGFYRSSQRFSVSLYKKAVEWLDDEFAKTPRDKLVADDLVKALSDAGDFEGVVAKQRAKTPRRLTKKASSSTPPSNGTEKDTKEAAELGFMTSTLNVTIKLPEGLSELPEGRFTLECISNKGLLQILSCSVKAEIEPQGTDAHDSPALQPDQPHSANRRAEPILAA